MHPKNSVKKIHTLRGCKYVNDEGQEVNLDPFKVEITKPNPNNGVQSIQMNNHYGESRGTYVDG